MGVNVTGIRSDSEFEGAVEKANGLIFSPLVALEGNANQKRVDEVIRSFPAMRDAVLGAPTSCNLTSIIHTGFITIRGSLKLKQIAHFTDQALAKEGSSTFNGADVTS
jgi:hypothetical protein